MRRTRPGLDRDRDAERGGEDQQRGADAVDREVQPDPEGWQPGMVQHRPVDHDCDDQDRRDDAREQRDGICGALGDGPEDTPGQDQGSSGHRRDQQGADQQGYHNVTPETPTASSPSRTQTRYEDGLRAVSYTHLTL